MTRKSAENVIAGHAHRANDETQGDETQEEMIALILKIDTDGGVAAEKADVLRVVVAPGTMIENEDVEVLATHATTKESMAGDDVATVEMIKDVLKVAVEVAKNPTPALVILIGSIHHSSKFMLVASQKQPQPMTY